MSDFTLIAGNSRTIAVTVIDGDTNHPADLRTADVRFKMGPNLQTAEPSFSIIKDNTCHGGVTVDMTNPPTGKLFVSIVPTDTLNLTGSFVYEVEVHLHTGELYTVKQGKCKVAASLIRDIDLGL